MGFKKVDLDELNTKISPNFLGLPIREGGKIVEKTSRKRKIESSYTGSFSEILILNEEFLEFDYDNHGNRKSALGNGNISIFNNSIKDRIWDANLQFSGSQFDDQNEDNNINLGIFEPSSNKVLKYEIVNTDEIADLINVYEHIENQIADIKTSSTENKEFIPSGSNTKVNLLRLGKENVIKFGISIENVSKHALNKIKFKKILPENFYDLDVRSNATTNDFRISRNKIEYSLNTLNPGDKAEINIIAKIFPKKREDISSGKIEITFNLLDKVISGVDINHFSGYSHAMHAIKKSEKNYAPNHWQCSLIFENHSDFKMKLKKVVVYDKSKSEKILEQDYSNRGGTEIMPRGKFTSEYFDFIDEREPTFTRKVEYSIDYKTESNSMIVSKYDESNFKIVGINIKKKLDDGEIKSFEESKLNSRIIINNEGTYPIKGLLITEKIPEDFLPPKNITDFQLYRSSGALEIEDLEIKVSPDDDDPSHEHTIELSINLKNNRLDSVVEVNDFLEIKYILKAVTPDYKKAYNFPLKVLSYYPKSSEPKETYEFYIITDDISNMEQSEVKISHKRRKLMIGKEIFPGRSSNEFAIYIVARNGSNMKLNEVDIIDTFPDSFELISSNLDHKLNKSKKNGEQTISFTIDTIPPFQEREIMYYVKNVSNNDIKQSELESYFVG